MSTNKLISTIQKELENLNENIDLKILKGQSYKRESRRHKQLLSQLRQIRYKSFFDRSFSFLTLF